MLVEPCRLEWYMEKVSYLLSILQGIFETSHLSTTFLFQVLGYTVTMLTVIVTVGTVIGCSAKTKFCQMAPKSTENH